MKGNYEQLIREIKRREQIEEALKERLKFETLLAELSAHFVNLPADRIDSNIEDAQRHPSSKPQRPNFSKLRRRNQSRNAGRR
jgi:hypothetical protein